MEGNNLEFKDRIDLSLEYDLGAIFRLVIVFRYYKRVSISSTVKYLISATDSLGG